MNVVVAIDSFKGSLSSSEAGNAIKEGVLKVLPNARVFVCPIADGGEGTTQALIQAMSGQMQYVTVSDPLGRPIEAYYGIIPQKQLAVIEMATAAGLPLLKKTERDPMYTTTKGVGEMICHAINKGCRNFLIGIGGSATNDGGVGMLRALGFEFLTDEDKPIPDGAIGLASIKKIEINNAHQALKECSFRIACDVKNPLCGETGCSRVFAPQKGASAADIRKMDKWLHGYADLTKIILPHADENAEGAGAAGGLGFAFQSYLGATLEPGIEIVLDEIALEEKIKNADIIVTGEGRLDSQSVFGKAPVGVATLARKYNKPVLAFAGSVTKEAGVCNDAGIDAYFSILQRIVTLEEAMQSDIAFANLRDSSEQVFRLVSLLNNKEKK